MTGPTADREALVPDALAFTSAALVESGALAEPTDDGALLLLPPPLARRLLLAEEIRLSRASDAAGAVPCGLGSPLLSRLVADARAQVPVVYARLQHEAPRTGQAAALGERFVVRNGLCELIDVLPGEATYVLGYVGYVAESDDRHEGLVRVLVHAPDGAAPDVGLGALLDATRGAAELVPQVAAPPGSAGALPWITHRAEREVRAALQHVQDSLARRHARDHARISEYFAALISEARSTRRKVDPQARAAKVAHMAAERDTKLADLRARLALRVRLASAALLCAVVPVVRVRLGVRRRKESRELVTRLPAGAHALDRLACDGCGGATARPALCDERLHVLCETCVPAAQGRPRCPACRGARAA